MSSFQLTDLQRIGSNSKFGECYAALLKPHDIRVAVKYIPIVTNQEHLDQYFEECQWWLLSNVCEEFSTLREITISEIARRTNHLHTPRLLWSGLKKYQGNNGDSTQWVNPHLQYKQVPTPDADPRGVSTMITDLCDGDMWNWLKVKHGREQWISMIVQCLFSLCIIEDPELSLSHRDSHRGNWLYTKIPNPASKIKYLRYIVTDEEGQHEFFVKSRDTWKIADFGKAKRMKYNVRRSFLKMHEDIIRFLDSAIGPYDETDVRKNVIKTTLNKEQTQIIFAANENTAYTLSVCQSFYPPAWQTLKDIYQSAIGTRFLQRKNSLDVSQVLNYDNPIELNIKRVQIFTNDELPIIRDVDTSNMFVDLLPPVAAPPRSTTTSNTTSKKRKRCSSSK